MFNIKVTHDDHTVTVDMDGETTYKDVIKGLKTAIRQISGSKPHEELTKELEQHDTN